MALLAKETIFVIVPTFVTKVTEYLCSGSFFLQTNFDFSTFDGIFFYIIRKLFETAYHRFFFTIIYTFGIVQNCMISFFPYMKIVS